VRKGIHTKDKFIRKVRRCLHERVPPVKTAMESSRSGRFGPLNKGYQHVGIDFIQRLYGRYRGTHLAPTSLFFDLVLESLVACDIGRAHDNLLNDIPYEMLSTKGFNFVMNGWAKCGDYHSGIKAQTLFEHLGSQQRTAVLRPNQQPLVVLLDAWGKSGHPVASHQIMTLFSEDHGGSRIS
jgi:hypothetical protein